MEFGRLPGVDHIDFSLPVDHPENAAWLRGPGGNRDALDLRIGLAGWADKGFVGRLYPSGVRERDFLPCHAQVLRTNELNSTYYGVSTDRFERWRSAVPGGFTFCPKLPSVITHELFLAGADAEMERFAVALERLGPACGRVWAALPPGFGPEKVDVLKRFLGKWAPRLGLAIELRHPGWFQGSSAAEAGFAALRDHGVAAIITDVAGRRDVLHMRLTAGETFVRFVGNQPHPSDSARIEAWAVRLHEWSQGGLERAWFFVHQQHDPDAMDAVRQLAKSWQQRTGRDPLPGLTRPPIPPSGLQGELF